MCIRNINIGSQTRSRTGRAGQKLHIHCMSLTTFQPHPWAFNARAAAERGERLTEDDGTVTLEDVFGGLEAVGALVIQVSSNRLRCEDSDLISCEMGSRSAMRISLFMLVVHETMHLGMRGLFAGTGTLGKKFSCVSSERERWTPGR